MAASASRKRFAQRHPTLQAALLTAFVLGVWALASACGFPLVRRHYVLYFALSAVGVFPLLLSMLYGSLFDSAWRMGIGR